MTTWFRRATCAPTDVGKTLRGLALGCVLVPVASVVPAAAAGDWSLDGQLRLRADHHREPSHSATRVFTRAGVDGVLARATLRLEAEGEKVRTPWGASERVGLGEAHLTWNGAWGTLRVGRQQIAWGRADGFRLLDEVNPQRYPQALFGEPQDARIPLWLANWEQEAGALQWQVLAGHDRALESADPAYPQLGGRVRDEPRHRGDAHVFGVRGGALLGEVDVSLYWLDGPDPRPPIRVEGDGLRNVPARRRLAGISLDRPLGKAVLRVEATQLQAPRLGAEGALTDQRFRQLLVGLDLRPGSWFVSPQLYRESGVGGGAMAATGHRDYASLVLQRTWLQDRLNVRGFWMGGIGSSDSWASLRLSYQWGPHVEWRAQWDRFSGPPGRALAALDELDRVGLEAVFHF